MKISRVMQLVFAGAALAFAVPAFATSSVDATAPISLCGGEKSEKSETTKKADKADKNEKASKAEKTPATS
jgi:hypothetical protein